MSLPRTSSSPRDSIGRWRQGDCAPFAQNLGDRATTSNGRRRAEAEVETRTMARKTTNDWKADAVVEDDNSLFLGFKLFSV
ncbi:UNVERIFIED_CONTAM: hypothetical protein Slati_0128200 [Sesamum latifolium]|uniref:Uncharacterized protein n=1 Tax=Sesamum latifolium TaxID=2727402 RepID=A0AAW2Y9Q3_9LAMI